jgi:hypothetical protein
LILFHTSALALKIISTPEHLTYVEPFADGAQMLFHKTSSNVEVLNTSILT